MDYTRKNLGFKVKKTLRYILLYGLSRTLVKVKSQYHMKRKFSPLPEIKNSTNGKRYIGILGCGNFSYSNIAYFVNQRKPGSIRSCMDIDINKAASLFKDYKLNNYTINAKDIINDPEIKLIYIASNHASHAEYAIEALKAGKNIHIEKPHVVNYDQLNRLCNAMLNSNGKVNLGFNRPNSKFGQLIRLALDNEDGPGMYNWFIAGHELPEDHWYYKESEGKRILGNLCHWTDFIYQLVPEIKRYPIKINPTKYIKSDCDIAVTYTFGDGTIAIITFSAKGHSFEGVREQFSAQKGNCLISMNDFKNLTIESINKKKNYNSIHRDHGHKKNILRSLILEETGNEYSVNYVWETGELFLKTKEALEKGQELEIKSFNKNNLISNIKKDKPLPESLTA